MPREKAHFLPRFWLAIALGAAATANANPYLDHYTYDLAFNGGVALDDRFATGSDTKHFDEKMLQLPNGEVVVAGLVPTNALAGDSISGNICLVHYTAEGGRTGWSNPTASYASYYNIYITFPNLASAAYSHIVDLKTVGNYIYVLADYRNSSTDKNVYIIVFGTDGSYLGSYAAFTTGLYEYGAGLVPYTYGYVDKFGAGHTAKELIAVATYDSGDIIVGGSQVPHFVVTMKRFTIGAGGGLGVDTTFGHIGNGAIDQPLPLDFCGPYALNPCSGDAEHVAAVRTDTDSPTLYLFGSAATYGNQAHDAFVMAVNGSSGDLLTSFGSNGIYGQSLQPWDYYGFTSSRGPSKGILATASSADPAGDIVYVTARYRESTGCSFEGATVTKIRANAGPPLNVTVPDFSWGLGGTATIAAAPNCAVTGAAASALNFYPETMASDGKRIAVVGFNSNGDPVFGAVRLTDGRVTAQDILPWLRSDGSRWEGATNSAYYDGGYQDVASAGDGKWTVTGSMCDITAAACSMFGTTRLFSDAIFGNGYD